MDLDDDFTIRITVSEPLADPSQKYFTYLLRGEDKLGPFEARRRFSEFFVLRETLTRRWMGLYVPPLPEKKALGNKDLRFVEERKRGLEYFARRMAAVKYLYYAEEFQILLRGRDPAKALQALPPVVPSFLRDKYLEVFGAVLKEAKAKAIDYHTKVTQFSAYLRNNQKNLKIVKEPVLDLADCRRAML